MLVWVISQFMHCSQGFNAIHPRHHMVHENNIVWLPCNLIKTCLSAVRIIDLNGGLFQKITEYASVHRIVVHQQNLRIRGVEPCLVILFHTVASLRPEHADRLGIFNPLDDVKGEPASLAVFTFDLQFTVHHGKQILGNCHPETGSLNVPISALFDPFKGSK